MYEQPSDTDITAFMKHVQQFHKITTNNNPVMVEYLYGDFLKWLELRKFDSLIEAIVSKE